MNAFHKIIQRGMVAAFVLCFVFVGTYVPQTWNKIEQAEAGAAAGGASEWTQIGQLVQDNLTLASTYASEAFNAITSGATNSMWIKENVLDGIAWALAKQIISQMTSSIVNWINSGFKGSPAFVQDLEGFLLNVGDKVIGQYLEELGGPFSFICSPFQLDVRVALAASYARTRDNQPESPSCTLTGALANLEGFMDGSLGFAEGGGWETWFAVTSNPTLTPYGSFLEVKSQASAKLINAKGQEIKLLDFGGGFLSSKVCEAVSGAGTTKENCFISTPGKVVQEALTFQLSTGPRSLIEADEFNEIVSALFGQIAKQAITGAAGLLGLSPSTGYTAPSFSTGSYTGALTSQPGMDPAKFLSLLTEARDTEAAYSVAINAYYPQLVALGNNIAVDPRKSQNLRDEAASIPLLISEVNANYTTLVSLINRFNALGPTPDPLIQQAVFNDFASLRTHSRPQVDADISKWQTLLK